MPARFHASGFEEQKKKEEQKTEFFEFRIAIIP
jgi:hypothetical protein